MAATLGLSQKFQKILIGTETARNPEQAGETVVKRHLEFQADTHGNAGDFRRVQNFPGRLRVHPVFVGHGESPQALDPGVHDQVGRRFAALGVGVVNMVVKSKLVPGFGHFRQMVAGQHAPHHTGRALNHAAEIMRQLELGQPLAVSAHHAFHDLHEHAGRIAFAGPNERC